VQKDWFKEEQDKRMMHSKKTTKQKRNDNKNPLAFLLYFRQKMFNDVEHSHMAVTLQLL